MSLESFIRDMPKVELHVHLEGSIEPSTLIRLAKKNNIKLPTDSVKELRNWYKFTDFMHFAEIYMKISSCIRNSEDIELITKEFLTNQSLQNIVHSEVTYTPSLHFEDYGIPYDDQLAAINRARKWGEKKLGLTMALVIDIPRNISTNRGLQVAEWAVSRLGHGVDALGLGGPEVGNPPEKFATAFELAKKAGLPRVPHAGETVGPESIWGSLNDLGAQRIGHGVRCLEDPELVKKMRDSQIPLEVCPTSNVCLNVCANLEEHPLPLLLNEGLFVTINSDDPPMFNTTLTNEFLSTAKLFNFTPERLQQFTMDALGVSLLQIEKKALVRKRVVEQFDRLKI